MYSAVKIPRPFCRLDEKVPSPPLEQTTVAESEPHIEAVKNPSAALPLSALLLFSFLSQQKEG